MKMIKCIPFFKTCNRQVDYIDKSYCSLTTVPEDIMRFSKTLEELYLNSNHIRELPKSFFRLTKLRKLSLHDNEFQVIPPDISNFVYLVELDASKNEFEEIPDAIRYCRQLQIIDFSSTYVTYLSPGVTQLHNLTTLYLNFNGISELPSDIGSLVNLQNLELRENELRFLPHSFGQLENLIRLDLGHNLFQVLPPLIGQLLNLEELWLDKNELRRLPGEIGNLRNLQSLDVTENKLECLPEEIILMENLVDLHLSKNLIEQLPDGIGHLSNLTILKLDQNNLLSLNPTIGGCSNLQELMLTENSLTELPPTIGNLTNLSILNLDLNKLEELPPQICNLSKLGIISLRNNNLTYLPNEMGQLKKLHVLDVANNQLQYLPYSITTLNLEALWLSENQSHPLLKFQTDYDSKTGNKVLTCFLLPQQKETCDSRSIENLLDSTLQRINSINWDQPKQQSQVKFHYDNEGVEDDDDNLGNIQSFVRHDTPHPKELKARHQKLFNKENNESNASTTAAINQSTNDQQEPMQSAESESSEASSVIVRQTHNETDGNPPSETKNLVKKILLEMADKGDIDNVDMIINNLDMETNHHLPDQQYLADHQYLDEQQQIDYQTEPNQDDYTMDGKHVIFNQNQESNENEDVNNYEQQLYDPGNKKLHRRDTPHHLKNKRINSMTNKADADKVASILDKLNNQMNYDEDTSVKTSSSSSVNNNNLTTNNLNNYNNNVNNLDNQTSTLNLANYQPMEPCEVKQLRFHLTRSPQYGLGLSIAGGKGSTPYKNNDESIFVSNVADKSPAYLAGLQKGDKILSVNDNSLEGAEHFRAVRVFKMAGEQFSVLISREVPIVPIHSAYTSSNSNIASSSFLPSYTSLSQLNSNGGIRNLGFDDRQQPQSSNSLSNIISNETSTSSLTNNGEKDSKIQYATLIRDLNGIGITVAYDEMNNICIESVLRSSSADGKIRINDKLVSINGKDIKKLNMTIDEVDAILNSGERFIRIVVERN